MKLLTVPEVAAILRVDRSTIYEWARERWLPSVALTPRAIRFRESDLEEFIRARGRSNSKGQFEANKPGQNYAPAHRPEPYRPTRRRLLPGSKRGGNFV